MQQSTFVMYTVGTCLQVFVSHLKQYAITQTFHKEHKFGSMRDGLPDGLRFLITSIKVCIVSYALTLQFLKHCISCKQGAAFNLACVLYGHKSISIVVINYWLCSLQFAQESRYNSTKLGFTCFTILCQAPV